MLSNKWTFSLTSLVVLIAFGLVCAVPSAFADGDANVNHYDIGVTLAAGETMVDVSAEDGFQIATGRNRSGTGVLFLSQEDSCDHLYRHIQQRRDKPLGS